MKTVLRLFAALCGLLCADAYASNLKVTLSPTQAVSAGAQWRVDGGTWRSSGTTVSGLSSGSHTVDYKAVTGWVAPASQVATLGSGTTSLTATYVQTASLKITLTPSTGKWAIDGGAWQNSATTVSNLAPGNHTVSYAAVSGYAAPSTETVALTAGQTTTLSRSYTQLAQLTLTLTPSSAQWQIDGGAWRASGSTATNLTPGSHTVAYSAVSGYQTLSTESVTLSAGQSLSLNRAYIALAQLTLTLTPNTGQWRVDSGAWQNSGATVANLALGSHTIDYNALNGYLAPSSESVTLTSGQTLSLSRAYTQMVEIWLSLVPSAGQWRANGGAWQASGARQFVLPGAVTVEYSTLPLYDSPATNNLTLGPGGIFYGTMYYVSQRPTLRMILTPTAGQWRVDGGAWQTSGASVTELDPGSHSLDYTDIGGDYAPLASETISLALREQANLSRSYSLKPASVAVTLTPSSAQWRVDAGTWQASGTTVNGLAPGNHALEYAALSGYTAPASETITLSPGQAASLSRSYVQLASLTIGLTPASAQWRIDNGAWQSTSATLTSLALGAHTIDYSDVAGYLTPVSESVTLVSGANSFARSYTPLASLSVSLTPNYAQWRIDGGAWQNTTTTLNALSLGNHTIDYSTISGYITPASETVALVIGANSLSRTYTALASLSLNLTPNYAQWRVDSGDWQTTSTTLNGLSLGNHLIDYQSVTGYITPASETLSLVSGTNTFSRSYTPLASLHVTLTPNYAQWRLDGGAWQTTSTTLNNLALGDHLIDYASVTGYITPPSETVTLVSGQTLEVSRSYTPLASLHVTLSPNYAQWRLDGGDWQYTSTTLNNLSLGDHTIDYAAVTGYIAPASETVTLVSGQTLEVSRNYTPLASLHVSLTPNYAQWRLDGGDWQYTSTTLNNLSLGAHTIDYASVIGYIAPTSETVTLTSGVTLEVSRSYTPLASLHIALTPNTGQWRLDGGAWQYTSTTLNNLALGAHTIDYLPVDGYTTPASETVTLVSGSNDLTRSYTSAGPAFALVKTFEDAGEIPVTLRGSDGALYVATNASGTSGYGQIFRLNADGTGYTIIHAFALFATDGFGPNNLIEGSDGVLYGTTNGGGSLTNKGCIFKLNKDGSGYAILHVFGALSDGYSPSALIEGSDGALYGTMQTGGTSQNYGVVFRMNKDGSGYTVLRYLLSSSDGSGPRGLTEGPGGALYGVTASGGTGSAGTVFKLNKDGSNFVVLKNLGGTNGSAARSGVLAASDGALYGTTTTGGSVNRGVVYRVTADGSSFTVLHNFLGTTTDGGRLDARLTEGPNGALYGVTFGGGSGSRGTVFQINKDGSGYAVIKSFAGNATEGGTPTTPLMVAPDGTLFGANTTVGGDTYGLLYRLNADGSGFTALRSFAAPDGSIPFAPVTEASDGVLYGTTYLGGGSAKGVLYRVNKDGSGYSVLHRFTNGTDGSYPLGAIVEGSDGLLYGAASNSSTVYGALYRQNKDGSGFTVIHAFGGTADGSGPQGLIEGSDGLIYGCASGGGSANFGTVFRMAKDGSSYTVLHHFAGGPSDGKFPYASVVEAPNGKLYGTTTAGGSADLGIVFVVNKDGTGYTILHQFAGGASDGATPYAGLYVASDGRLYGTTTAGGSANLGTLFSLATDGSGYTVFKQFSGSDGSGPYYGSLIEKNGVLYGTAAAGGTFSGGVLFSINKDGTGYTVLVNFNADATDAKSPAAGLFKSSDGYLYGTTAYGAGGGSVYRLRVN